MNRWPSLGFGIGWRPELAWFIERRQPLGFVEVLAENMTPGSQLSSALRRLQDRGVQLIPHGVSLGLGGTDRPAPERLDHLSELATQCAAPYVSEHLAFVRAGGLESGHLLPLPYTDAMLDVLVENIQLAQQTLPVPLVLENIASLFTWPTNDWDEADFIIEILQRTSSGLLLDLENVYANCRNRGGDPMDFIRRLPLDRVAYMHVAGGIDREGIFHDTHTYVTSPAVLDLLEQTMALHPIPGVMLERDGNYPDETAFNDELNAIMTAALRGSERCSAKVEQGS